MNQINTIPPGSTLAKDFGCSCPPSMSSHQASCPIHRWEVEYTASSQITEIGAIARPLADVHYQDPTAPSTLAATLAGQFRAEGKPDKYLPVFFMVGATSSTGDSLGPFIGWFLSRKGFTGEYVGDLNEPVHARNIKEKLNEAWERAMKQNKFPYIVAVDAAVGRPGSVTVNRGPLKPGAGMGKTLPEAGTVHVMGNTADLPFMIWFADLDQTVAMAEVIADGLLGFWKEYESGRLFQPEVAENEESTA